MDINDGKLNAKMSGYFADGDTGIKGEMSASAGALAREETVNMRRIFTGVLVGILYAFFGYVFGLATLPFAAKPFGIAFLCASDRKTGYIYLGLCLSTAGSPLMMIYICAYTAALFIRMLSRLTIDIPRGLSGEPSRSLSEVFPAFFSEHVFLRMATACLSSFIVGIYCLTVGGFLYYDLYGAILSLVAAPAAVILMSGQFGITRTRGRFADFSFLFMASVLVYFSKSLTFQGISFSAFGAMFATLFVCRRRGVLSGMVAGTILGLAYSPLLAPSFAFGALIFGLFSPLSGFFAAMCAFTAGMAWAFYAKGISVLTGFLPALLCACVLLR